MDGVSVRLEDLNSDIERLCEWLTLLLYDGDRDAVGLPRDNV